jgi:hypothetical protein
MGRRSDCCRRHAVSRAVDDTRLVDQAERLERDGDTCSGAGPQRRPRTSASPSTSSAVVRPAHVGGPGLQPAAWSAIASIELMHKRWGGPLVAHLQGEPEQTYATAIGSLLEALHER